MKGVEEDPKLRAGHLCVGGRGLDGAEDERGMGMGMVCRERERGVTFFYFFVN